jgi:hypothetical protein
MAVYVYKLRGPSRLLMGRTAPPPPLFGLMASSAQLPGPDSSSSVR